MALKISLEDTTKSRFSKIPRSTTQALSFAAFVFAAAATLPALANPGDPARAESSLSVRERQARDAGRRSLQENNLLTLHGTSSQDGFTDFYGHSATAFSEKIVLSNGKYHMPIGLGSGDYKQSWRFSKYAAFCEALEKRDQNECGAFVAYNVKHNSLRGVKGQASSVELDPARILVLHREVVDEGRGKMASRPTTKKDPSLGIWDVLYDVTQNRKDKNGRDATAFLSTSDEYFLLKSDNGERKFAHVYFRKGDELVAFLADYAGAFNKTRPQPASVPTPPAPSVPPVHIPPAQVPVPPASTVSPTAVPRPVPPESDPRPPKKKDLFRPVESLTAGLTHTRTNYYDGDDVVSMKDSALEASVKFQMRKPQWSAFLRGRITGSATLSGHIGYQNKTIGEYRRFKGATDVTAALPFGKGQIIEFGPYVSQTTRYVKFNLGEVQREEETVNYGLLLRG
ncbi:hypothetical protein HY772_08925, partial [Candidatus Woesearchaeota archaeon]|nr:hypothetical protein [Candidatus Woesearchaeota archaeon]